MDMCVNVCGLHHMTVHAIITTLSWNNVTTCCRALEHPHNTNADSQGHSADQPITPETVILDVLKSDLRLFVPSQFLKKHSKGTDVTCHWGMNDFEKCHVFSTMHAFFG